MYKKLTLLLLLVCISNLAFYGADAQTPTIPERPTNLQAYDVSPTQVDLFWNTPQNDGGSPITGYKIQVRTTTSSYSDVVSNTQNATTKYSHTGLTTGTTYIYRVYSINQVGQSEEASPEAIATPTQNSKPLENIPPNSPTSLTATDVSPTEIKLSWIKPATNNGPPVTGYKIEVKIGSGNFQTLVDNTDKTSTKYDHSGLSTNTKYTYRVFAINSIGNSAASNEASATPTATSSAPTENIAPNPPRNVDASPGGPTKIVLSWNTPTPNNSPPVSGYKIEYKTSGNYTQLTTTGTVLSYTHDGLNEGTQYTYRIYAINSAGTSSPSSAVSAKPAHTQVPTNLKAVDISPTSILLTWTAPSQTFGGTISGYTIKKVIGPDIYDEIAQTNDKKTSYTVTGLETGKEYTFVVNARFNIGANSDYSNEASATPTSTSKPPTQFSIPSPPTNLVAQPSSPTQIDLSWGYPTSDGGTAVTGYRIDVKVGNANFVTLKQNTESAVRGYSHTQVTPETTYTYKVYAINSAGTSASSNEASATPSETTKPPTPKERPSPPRSLLATTVSPNQVNLSWQEPQDDGGEPITGYKIEVREGQNSYRVLSSNIGKNTMYSHTGLQPDTVYHYRVSAINSVGTSNPSSESSVTTESANQEAEQRSNILAFIDPKKGAQHYLDRYYNEPNYKEWFDRNYPDYTIEEALELAITDFTKPTTPKPILAFVDQNRDPQYYITRYNSEPNYKAWFDETYPDYTIYEAVGIDESKEPPAPQERVCGPGTVLVDGVCQLEKKETPSGGGCLIATAAFGSELAPPIQMLREIRDGQVLSTTSGTAFMTGFNQFYYSFSPTVADWERENPVFKETVKLAITPLLITLSILNYVDIDSEEEMLGYGIVIISLNIGMYFVAPAMIVLRIKNLKSWKSCRE